MQQQTPPEQFGEPSLSLPCFAERRYGGVPDEEMLMALQPSHLAKAVAGMGVSYGKK
jgi:uncharacterized protein (DUF169 family)